jgi:DNA primase
MKDTAGATVADVAISHPQHEFGGSDGLTKLDLARYYEAVSEWLRPHLADRPLAVLRCPGGDFRACFFQRHAHPGMKGEKRARNGETATAVAAYSARARPGLPVSTPVGWEELKNDLRGATFDIRTVPARLRQLKNDPWAEYWSGKQRITVAARRALSSPNFAG